MTKFEELYHDLEDTMYKNIVLEVKAGAFSNIQTAEIADVEMVGDDISINMGETSIPKTDDIEITMDEIADAKKYSLTYGKLKIIIGILQ